MQTFRINRVRGLSAALVALSVLATLLSANSAGAAYPGQNGRIAYSSNGDIWTVKPDGTDRVNLTENVTFGASTPAFSPDGRWIAFEDESFDKHLWAISTAGGRLLNLTRKWDEVIFQPSHVTWSPTGRLIAFTAMEYNGSSWRHLYVMPVDGSRKPEKLTDGLHIYYPEWSPAGDDILFVEGTAMYLIDKDGGEPRLLYDGGSINDPAWSPNGQEIVFDEEVFMKPALLRVVDRDGNIKREYEAADQQKVVAEPAWSPDGEKIVFMTVESNIEQLMIIDAQFQNGPEQATNYVSDKRTPDWGVVPPPDNTAPTVRITSGPAAGSRTTKRTARFTFTSNEFGSRFLCKLDDGPRRACTSPKSYGQLSVGGHTFRVWARDIAGNLSTPAARSWTVKRG